MSHRVQRSWKDKLKAGGPFGLGQTKPKHFRDMAKVVWANRDNLPYAWKVLSKGVCDGCALGVAGFHDWTIDGVHLCTTRLKLLEVNTAGPLDHRLLADVARLKLKTSAELRALDRLAFPMRRRRGEKGFTQISSDEATRDIADSIVGAGRARTAIYLPSRRLSNERYHVAGK